MFSCITHNKASYNTRLRSHNCSKRAHLQHVQRIQCKKKKHAVLAITQLAMSRCDEMSHTQLESSILFHRWRGQKLSEDLAPFAGKMSLQQLSFIWVFWVKPYAFFF